MLLQTNSYVVPKDKRTEHARLVKRFRQVMGRLGLTDFDVYEQAGPNWSTEVGGRFVQLMRFRDRDHQQAVRTAEQADASAQDLVREFCELVNFGYQQQQGIATTAFYLSAHATAAALTGGHKRLGDNGALGSSESNGETHAVQAADDATPDRSSPAAEPFPMGSPARTSAQRDDED